MEVKIISTNIANGTVHFVDHMEKISEVEWKKHPKFKGIYLKNMINGFETDGLFSSHLVKIDPGCTLEYHCHEENMELHEVIEGAGTLKLDDKIHGYHPGKMAVIPKSTVHMVEAGNAGLTLLAKFFPALN